MGRSIEEVTTYIYDEGSEFTRVGRFSTGQEHSPPKEHGTLLQAITTSEPYWLPEDTEAVLEWQQEQALLCPGCGFPRDETMAPEAEGDYHARALRCHACASRDRKSSEFSSHKHARLEGLMFGIERIQSR